MKKFSVSNPVKISGHIKYKVSGEDSEGPFEENRRFKEFFSFRNVLVARWPGIYIPALPEKKMVVRIYSHINVYWQGNKDDEFVEERR